MTIQTLLPMLDSMKPYYMQEDSKGFQLIGLLIMLLTQTWKNQVQEIIKIDCIIQIKSSSNNNKRGQNGAFHGQSI